MLCHWVVSASRYRFFLPGLGLAAAWVIAIRQLALEWSINPQYQYGWLVPFLTAFLWFTCWSSRPEPQPAWQPAWWLGGVTLLILFSWPLRLIQEANPEWRILSIFFAFQAVFCTAWLLNGLGGRAWLKHFLFPLLFPLVAVPWPSDLEQTIIQTLQHFVAALGVEGATWAGYPAEQRGNLILLPTGIVGIDDACSGIRSLQSSFMIALFLGEYFHLTLLRRGGLLLAGLALTFVFNVLRALILIAITLRSGPESFAQWHDPAGFTILILCFVSLWFLAQRGEGASRPAASAATLASPRPWTRWPSWTAVLLIGWGSAEIVTAAWYHYHERRLQNGPAWSLPWPLPENNFSEIQIGETARVLLRYDEAHAGQWIGPEGSRWQLFYLQWNPGRTASQLARGHRPDICLPATGRILEQDLGIQTWIIRGVPLPMHRYIFIEPGGLRRLFVFQAITEDKIYPGARPAVEDNSRSSKLRAAWEGRRNQGQRSLQVAVQGVGNMAEAEALLQRLLEKNLRLDQPGQRPVK